MLKKTDILKAVGVALVLMVVNVAISFPVVGVYAYFIEPGHEAEFYEEAAQWIAPWSSVVVGVFLFFGALYWFTRRAPERHAIGFALAVASTYAVVDLAIVAGAGALASIAGIFALSMATKFAAAIAGASVASRS
ncbi:MAG: hypothetical protein VYE73_05610 [Acidobacteriota bacterium]|nr:hypothetical protein [Acidobacteriota bacterium]